MVFLHIDKKNCMDGNCNNIDKLDTYLGNKKNKTFILIFMEGCGPCNATRPEWTKIQNVLSSDFLNRDDIIISAIDNILAEKLKNLKRKPSSFPTMRFIEGSQEENYEETKNTLKYVSLATNITNGRNIIAASEEQRLLNLTTIRLHKQNAHIASAQIYPPKKSENGRHFT